MNEAVVPFVRSVLHPTDFSPASEAAFAHALVVALVRQARLTILNASSGTRADADRYPQIRGTLQRWGLLEEGSPRSAIYEQLGMEVRKVDVSVADLFMSSHIPDSCRALFSLVTMMSRRLHTTRAPRARAASIIGISSEEN